MTQDPFQANDPYSGHSYDTRLRGYVADPQGPYYIAGFWIRVLAVFIDEVLIGVVRFFVVVAIVSNAADADISNAVIFVVVAIVSIIMHGLYYVSFWTFKQATPGKIAIRAELIDVASGGKPALKQLIGRWLLFGVLLWIPALPLWLLFLRVALSDRKRGYHDIVGKTMVVHRELVPETR